MSSSRSSKGCVTFCSGLHSQGISFHSSHTHTTLTCSLLLLSFVLLCLHPLQLRVAQVTNGAASKLGKIRLVRKNIARVLTVVNQKSLDKMKGEVAGLKRVPKQLRAKKTRAIRRALTKEQVR
jgi:hypothetical protein